MKKLLLLSAMFCFFLAPAVGQYGQVIVPAPVVPTSCSFGFSPHILLTTTGQIYYCNTANRYVTSTPGPDVDYPFTSEVFITAYTTTPVSITPRECRRGTVTNQGAGIGIELDLPAATTVGMVINVLLKETQDIDIDPNGTDQIEVLTNGAGDRISSDSAVGSFITLLCAEPGIWTPVGYAGVWTDIN